MSNIKLNDILKIENLDNVKIRFLTNDTNGSFNPLEKYRNDPNSILEDLYHKQKKNVLNVGEIVIGLLKIKQNRWLLIHIGEIVKDLDIKHGVSYEGKPITEHEKYFGRVIVNYEKTFQQPIVSAKDKIDNCFVHSILPDIYNDDLFPGYENVCINWETLNRIKDKVEWQTALKNQKGVYLITDRSNGKMYVGAAYGQNMILGRWESYIKNGHGGNEGLKDIDFEYIKKNFQYSILEIFQANTLDDIILVRESWWKKVLISKEFGYNNN